MFPKPHREYAHRGMFVERLMIILSAAKLAYATNLTTSLLATLFDAVLQL